MIEVEGVGEVGENVVGVRWKEGEEESSSNNNERLPSRNDLGRDGSLRIKVRMRSNNQICQIVQWKAMNTLVVFRKANGEHRIVD